MTQKPQRQKPQILTAERNRKRLEEQQRVHIHPSIHPVKTGARRGLCSVQSSISPQTACQQENLNANAAESVEAGAYSEGGFSSPSPSPSPSPPRPSKRRRRVGSEQARQRQRQRRRESGNGKKKIHKGHVHQAVTVYLYRRCSKRGKRGRISQNRFKEKAEQERTSTKKQEGRKENCRIGDFNLPPPPHPHLTLTFTFTHHTPCLALLLFFRSITIND